ncbi:MAG: energy-coupling factor transporter transmembrane protein EcfT [Bacillati bacterium ANGP1]|uniref:Energy-coupling factor transporter transmembrane protein EcfT n=1 Tax=Candidatus Segetimicrobium genomatis TaxID=2569760 RepID=A0A537JW42_9BACT|nr:MAG: energy-coupling factor transporter transmembrane protein EcfT [Terrabacteria group bacterium ANGP1]
MELFKGLVLGQYVPVDSAVHRLDPRTKILAALGLLGVIFAIRGFAGLAVLTAVLAAATLVARIRPGYVVRGVRPLLWLLVFAFALQVFFGEEGGHPLARWGPLVVTRENLSQAAFYGWRLLLLVFSTTLMTLTTSPVEFTDGLERLLRPFQRVGVPAHDLAMMMTIALRFIPTLLEEAEKIMKAQMARGAEFARGSLPRRARALLPLLVPLFVSAFRRADALAVAMEARCYRGGEHRTRMRELRLRPRDYTALFLVAAAAALALVSPAVWRGR